MRRGADSDMTSAPPWLWLAIACGVLAVGGLWWWAL
jgi:hypothetical protein